jgi:hypothetical protein
MNSKKLFFILIAAVVLACGALIGGAYFADQNIQKFSKQIVAKRAKVASLNQQQDSLITAKKDIVQYEELAHIAKTIVPQDKDQAQTVREIVNIASANGIKLGSITFPSSSLGESATGGTGTTVAPKVTPNAALSQLIPVKEIPGVYSLQIIVASDANAPVTYSRFVEFLNDLEHNRRTALVSSITITPDKINRANLTFTLTLDEYVKPAGKVKS